MPKRVFQCAALIVAIAAAGCAQYPGMPSSTSLLGRPMGDASGRPMALSSVPGLTVSGLVLAPAGVISAGGANVISAGGANVVSAGGGNVISAGGANWTGARAVLSLSDEQPVSGASVYLADMTGRPLAGTAQAVSDGQGRYAFHQVPPDVAYMVVATIRTPRGDATLRSLGVSGQGSGEQVVSVASTLVTLAVTQSGATDVTPEAFKAATVAVAADLRDDALPDLTRPAEVAALAQTIATTVAPVRQVVAKSPAVSKEAPPVITEPPVAPPAASSSSAGPNGASYTPVDAGVPAPDEPTGSGSTEVPTAPEAGTGEPDSADADGQPGTAPESPTSTQPSDEQAPEESSDATEPIPTTQPPGHGHGHDKDKDKPKDKDKDKDKDKGKGHDKDHVPPGQAKKDP